MDSCATSDARRPWSPPSSWSRSTTFTSACLINRYYDPSTDQFLSVDPDVQSTDQPYIYTNDDPLNLEDPLGLSGYAGAPRCESNCGGDVFTDVANHWRGIAQVGTIFVGGAGEALCTLSVACAAFGGDVAIGAATSTSVYAESGGSHSVSGYAEAAVIGGIVTAGASELTATASSFLRATTAGVVANSSAGAAEGVADYLGAPGKKSVTGALKAGAEGALEGAVPYQKITNALLKIMRER
jgi:uncharacterized protein RhaS with RHS repeats